MNSSILIKKDTSLDIIDLDGTKYLNYVTYTQTVFRNLVETARQVLSPEDWENYRQTHPDIIAAYDNYNEETNNPLIIGFKYK